MPIRARESSAAHSKRRRADQRWLNDLLAQAVQEKAAELGRLAELVSLVTDDPQLRQGYHAWLASCLPFPVLRIPKKKTRHNKRNKGE